MSNSKLNGVFDCFDLRGGDFDSSSVSDLLTSGAECLDLNHSSKAARSTESSHKNSKNASGSPFSVYCSVAGSISTSMSLINRLRTSEVWGEYFLASETEVMNSSISC